MLTLTVAWPAQAQKLPVRRPHSRPPRTARPPALPPSRCTPPAPCLRQSQISFSAKVTRQEQAGSKKPSALMDACIPVRDCVNDANGWHEAEGLLRTGVAGDRAEGVQQHQPDPAGLPHGVRDRQQPDANLCVFRFEPSDRMRGSPAGQGCFSTEGRRSVAGSVLRDGECTMMLRVLLTACTKVIFPAALLSCSASSAATIPSGGKCSSQVAADAATLCSWLRDPLGRLMRVAPLHCCGGAHWAWTSVWRPPAAAAGLECGRRTCKALTGGVAALGHSSVRWRQRIWTGSIQFQFTGCESTHTMLNVSKESCQLPHGSVSAEPWHSVT